MLDREQVLALGVRREIFELIKQSPGLHFREIKRRTNLAIGALQYHLNVLEKNNFHCSIPGIFQIRSIQDLAL